MRTDAPSGGIITTVLHPTATLACSLTSRLLATFSKTFEAAP